MEPEALEDPFQRQRDRALEAERAEERKTVGGRLLTAVKEIGDAKPELVIVTRMPPDVEQRRFQQALTRVAGMVHLVELFEKNPFAHQSPIFVLAMRKLEYKVEYFHIVPIDRLLQDSIDASKQGPAALLLMGKDVFLETVKPLFAELEVLAVITSGPFRKQRIQVEMMIETVHKALRAELARVRAEEGLVSLAKLSELVVREFWVCALFE